MMKTSSSGKNLIKRWEGLRLTAYRDPVGVWTIGYGHTKDVYEGQTITVAQADAMLEAELAEYEGYVNDYVTANLNQNQFDALVSFVYNVGPGNFAGSTLLRKVNADPDDPTIPAEFKRWNRAGGEILNGLTRRRNEEAELYATDPKKKRLG